MPTSAYPYRLQNADDNNGRGRYGRGGRYADDTRNKRDNGFGSIMTEEEEIAPPEPEYKKFLREFFHKEPCVFSHTVYQHAATVLEALRHDPRDQPTKRRGPGEEKPKPLEIPNIDFENENEKRLTFTLVFSSLKCKYLI